MRTEQAELKRLIKAADGAVRRPALGEIGDNFEGVGFALACWLDDLFIIDPASPWRTAWKEESIEFALYRSQDRASKFWQQARQAELRADFDALEVFYLCQMLGFRGEYRDNPAGLRDWRARFEGVLRKSERFTPPELPVPPPTAGRLLRAASACAWVLLAWALIGSGAILLAVFSVVYRFGG